jgi:biopolymer transport protein ExbB
MPSLEPLEAVRELLERGGSVLWLIALATFLMWTLILERIWYFWRLHPGRVHRLQGRWEAREDQISWSAHQVRRALVSRTRLDLERFLPVIRTLVALCPLLGLLGTVTGMIEVFDVMALAGSSNARAMASGVSKATIPTMAGMVAALSGLIVSVQLDRFAREQTRRVADRLLGR